MAIKVNFLQVFCVNYLRLIICCLFKVMEYLRVSRVPNKEVGLDFLARLDEFTVHLIYL